ncbi:phosphate acyltransferase PlsX [Govanella unica]|uniref:Phosphate acyltransferase n=1 Tax=Govanella unica TaxID=2975056 RepID=A0A9X3TYG3_9PROT|nr:phosphate acyltransferase PlsX [Govania unica]MDA5194098.1 phosphate acyltransferase PlsX [Govania unica]
MKRKLSIALDAMGGDHAPAAVVDGAEIARERYPNALFRLFGDEAVLKPLVARYPKLQTVAVIEHTDSVVTADDKPGQALRRGRGSSMGLAIEAVSEGRADVAVSAGNTGALMALAKFMLKTMPGIDRPALATLIPTTRGESVMLDLGANVECDDRNLVEFAVMGAAFARTVLGVPRPTVALLNVGVEELKGKDAVKAAGQTLKDSPLPFEFTGFVEGDDIAAGTVDVVVTDGFTGNVALKTAEGTARMIAGLTRNAFANSLGGKLGYFFAQRGMRALRAHLDPNNHNGAVFLGLNGLVVKSHGGASALGIASAIGVAHDLAADDLMGRIAEDLKSGGADTPSPDEVAT